MSKKHIFLSIFSKIAIFACVFCAFFVSPVFASLPAGYTELEYIQGDKSAYLKSGIILDNNSGAEAKFQFPNKEGATTGNFICGARNSGPKNAFTLVGFSGGNYWAANYNNSAESFGSADTSIHTMKRDKEKVYFDGSLVLTSASATFTTPGEAYIFSINQGGAPYLTSNIKLWYLKMWDNRTLVRDYVPAKRTADNVLGMYDTVSGTFFTNSGTGDFIAGPIAHCKTFETDGVTCAACKSGYKLDSNGGCVGVIEIATTKMVDDEFAAAEANLAATVQTIESVVSRTIAQTGQIQVLQDTKQTRPDESCPANMKCLLVQDEDGTPHWYPIIEP